MITAICAMLDATEAIGKREPSGVVRVKPAGFAKTPQVWAALPAYNRSFPCALGNPA